MAQLLVLSSLCILGLFCVVACVTPSARVLFFPPRIVEELQQSQEGDELSVFTNLVSAPEGLAEEATSSTCNQKELAPAVTHTVRLPSFPTVSYRVTPTGDATLSLQWEQQQQ